LTRADALRLARQASDIYAAKGKSAKGKSVVHIDLKKDKPSDETLVQVLLGPTGNLRAPTLRVGKTLIVGFDAEMYGKLLGKT
jgi:hypothetical protein